MPGAYDDIPQAPDPLLSQVMPRESGGKNLPPTANYDYPHSHASGVIQFQPQTWRDTAKATGLGMEYAEAYQAPVDVQIANGKYLEKKYGLNSPYTWAASAPRGGYKEAQATQTAKGSYDDIPMDKGGGKNAYDDIPMETKWRVPPANEGPREKINLSPQTDLPSRPTGPMDPSIIARQARPTTVGDAAGAEAQAMQNVPGAGFARSLATPQQWAAMAADPKNPMWQRVMIATMEEGKRIGWNAMSAAGVFGDVAKGNASMADPATQKRVLDAAGWFGARGAPGELKGAAAAKPVDDPLGASVEMGGLAPMHDRPAIQEGASVGAAVVPKLPIHEVLAQNMRAREASLSSTDPTLRQNMRAAANVLKSFTAPETARSIETGEQTGMDAAASIRKYQGRMKREQDIAANALNQYQKTFNGVTPEEGLAVLRWLQDPKTKGSSAYGGYEPIPEIEGFMNTFSNEMIKVRRLMESLPKTESMQFKENFVSQMWKNPWETMGRLQGLAPKGGSGYFTKKSVWDSYEDGIRQGGVPLTTNPLEIGVRYLENAYKWLGENQIIDEGAEQGRIVWRYPGNQPKGWMQLNGRAEHYKGQGQVAYAPPEYAQVYNNYTSTLPQGAMGGLLRSVQKTANVTTMAKLGLSYFHAGLMANESMASGFANAIDNLAGGKFATALLKTAEAPIYPITSIWRAREGIKAYFDKTAGSIKTQKAVNALVDANFRLKGRGNIADEYRASFLPDFFDSLKKGRLKLEATQAMADIAKHPVLGTGRQIANLVFRTLDTASAPIFQYMVPRLKTGAALDMMYTYMRRNPDATDEEIAGFARKASNMIDDRFGEMNHDNIFLHKVQKSFMQSLLVSFSYEYGSARSAIGAGVDASKLLKNGWTSRLSYPIGLFTAMAVSANIYQYLMTGKPAGSMQDIRNPQTGGTDPKTGLPGRAILPSQLNQAFNLWNDPGEELGAKVNTMWKTSMGLVSAMGPTGGYDWKNDPIVNKNAPGIDQLAQAGYFAMQGFNPMIFEQQPAPGSAIPPWQRFEGARDAPRRAVDPAGSAEGLRYVNAQKAVEKKQHDGELPRYLPYQMKKKYIQQEMNRYRGPS